MVVDVPVFATLSHSLEFAEIQRAAIPGRASTDSTYLSLVNNVRDMVLDHFCTFSQLIGRTIRIWTPNGLILMAYSKDNEQIIRSSQIIKLVNINKYNKVAKHRE